MARAGISLRYAVRSMRRGGSRTVLAVFCIAVGVMAIVSLRLAGDMIAKSLTNDVRAQVGGDVLISSTSSPLTPTNLITFDTLRDEGLITGYEPLGVQSAFVRHTTKIVRLFPLYTLPNPSIYPLAGAADFTAPPGATFGSTLREPDTIVLSSFVAEQADHARVGDMIHVNVTGQGGADLRISGILGQRVSVNGTATGYITPLTAQRFTRSSQAAPTFYGAVNVTTPSDAAAAAVALRLRATFPTATVQTVREALNANTQAAAQVSEYLQIVGLLALLIGGIGIVNTLQVMLSRRRIEIAMLKTFGYRRAQLYALFGLETGLMGLTGGVLGTGLGIVLSYGVKRLIERVVSVDLAFTVSGTVLMTGVGVGLFTSLIFGLLPIVRASTVRPQAVLRGMNEGRTTGSLVQTLALYALLVVMFTVLCAALLSDARFAIALVIGTVIGISVLGVLFLGLVIALGHLPVPERASARFVALISLVVALAAAVALQFRAVGVALLVASTTGYALAFLPRRAKIATKLAIRSLSRGRVRTASTLVALFTGVFTVGLILVIGQDLSGKIDDSLTTLSNFNIFAVASAKDGPAAVEITRNLAGAQQRLVAQDVGTTPTAINGRSIAALVPPPTPGRRGDAGGRFAEFSGVEGYDLAHGSFPDTTTTNGRALTRADAGSGNVLVRESLRGSPFRLRAGDTVTLRDPKANVSRTVTVVGFYAPVSPGSGGGLNFHVFLSPIIGDVGVPRSFGDPNIQTFIKLKVDPAGTVGALKQIEDRVPDVSVYDIADLGAIVSQILGNLITLLVALASLALFAGIVIIANAVALAMLERRREMGILKATGHTSTSVLAQVLIENGIIGALGGITGMAVVTIATSILGRYTLKTDLAVGVPIVLLVIAGIMLLTVSTALLVAWRPTHARPLEVLRYE